MNNIKVLHLTYDMRIGGTESVIKNLVEGAADSEVKSEILCIQPKLGAFGEQLVKLGVKITCLNWHGGFDLSLIKLIRQYIIDNRINVLHCHQYTPWVYGAIAAAFTSTRVIFTEHGRFYPDTSSWKRRLVNPILLKLTDHVTAISKATKQALIDYEFIPSNKVDVIYNGIKKLESTVNHPSEIRTQLGIPHYAAVLGTVARLDPIKNQVMMIKAFKKVLKAKPDTYLIIIGDGEEKQKLEKLVSNLKIEDKVIFTGYIAAPVEHISLMDVFLLSSLSEGTSMTLLEAMSLAKPCVVTDAGGNSEIISDGKTGFVTANGESTPFADAIIKLLSDQGLHQEYSQAAFSRFKELFDYKIMLSEYQKLLSA